MSNPDNGAARNTMSEFERQCYDWGWADSEDRIIKLLDAEIERVSNPMLVDREYLDGLEMALEFIKVEPNPHARAETKTSTALTTENIVNSACSCGCKGENK